MKGILPFHITAQDQPQLMSIYGLGFILIYFVFFLMYLHTLHKKEELQLTPTEQFDTKTKMFAHVALLMVGLLSVIVSQLLPALLAGSAGMINFLIGPAVTVLHTIRGRKRRKLYGHS